MDRDKISDGNLAAILGGFCFEGEYSGYERYGCGHINDTFLFSFKKDGEACVNYIVQRVNGGIFKDVPSLMKNFELVTDFLKRKAEAEGIDASRGVLTLIYTKNGESFVESGGEFFRAFVFIDRATSYQTVGDPSHFFQAGRAFGRFAALLDDFDAAKLFESIPDFHDTGKRYQNFLNALAADKAGRAKDAKEEIEFTAARRDITDRVTRLLSSGEIPLRVTHNDTKLNNVMIDDQSGEALAVIDLDTVMPGSLLYDFGDSIRFGCNSAAEDERDLSKVGFDIGLFKKYAEGYLGEVKRLIKKSERDLLYFAPILMTFECGMRFLTDYLDGDVYFKTKYDSHNLDRAKNQYKLVLEMEGRSADMKGIIDSIK
ncbi:MAG: aminoglycoside phosphotransferase family protein [Clostridiales bacterium]|jgi:hypothetical protein|nr:aminoglycoside phosphotransferase family protein [Clostridiales bacterium]